MIAVSLPGPTTADIERQIKESLPFADFFEFRTDLYHGDQRDAVLNCPKPTIVTCRKGGTKEIALYRDLKPAFFDLDDSIPLDFQRALPKKIGIIRSVHDFQKTPSDLGALLGTLTSFPADIFKIATYSKSTLEGFRLLRFCQNNDAPLAVVGMGEMGQCTRILGASAGSKLIYASPNETEKTAPGQISAEVLKSLYAIGDNRSLYGLIGDPVSQSFGHLFHNGYMTKRGALYVRLRVQKEELVPMIALAKELGFRGLSVTIPHKERIVPLLDHLDPPSSKIGAVNTIKFEKGRLIGTNTDAKAALDALSIDVRGKKIALIGAGGAARAIAFEAKRRGARVALANRTLERAELIAQEFGLEARPLHDIGSYDVLINATPNGMPVDPGLILPGVLAMDISLSESTQFLQEVEKKGGTGVNGKEMFKRQAEAQAKFWSF